MQKFQIQSKVLSDVLNRIYYAVDDKATVPAFAGVKFELAGHKLRLSTRGSVIDTEAILPLESSNVDGVFGLGLKLFAEVVNNLPEGLIEFKLTDKDVQISAGTARFKLSLLVEAVAFPPQNLCERTYVELDMPALLDAVGKVIYCHDDRASESYKRAVCINPAHVVSTDGFRLSYVPNKAFRTETPIMLLFLTPAMERLLKIYAGASGPAGIGADRSGVYIHCNGIYTATRVPEAKYPNYASILPRTQPSPCTAPRRVLAESLKRVLVLIGEKGMKNVDFVFDQEQLHLVASGSGGDAHDTIRVVSGAVGKVRLNGEFVLKSLSKMTGDTIVLEHRPAPAPVIITDGEHVNVFQPISVGTGEEPAAGAGGA